MISSLADANQAFQKGQTTNAMAGYVNALLKMPELAKAISGNISRTREKYLKSRNKGDPLKVVVCGWELAHNAAGRAHTLAEIYREITRDVEIVGSIFPRWGREVWEPIRETTIPINTFVVEPSRFIEQALGRVAAHPADVVHLSKPRAPNIFFGVFYKLLWGAKVIVDIDDEELAFVKAETPLILSEYLQKYETLPIIEELTDAHWTRIAVGMAKEFDAVTVSNPALQSRYGGVVIGHARDPKVLKPSSELRQKMRQNLGIQLDQKVVLFSGTPRPHKGLLEVAQAIKAIQYTNIVFVIAGSFGKKHQAFKAMLQDIKGVKYIFIENQPVAVLQRTMAIADCCVLLQDTKNPVSHYQLPAKLSDALAMKIPVIATYTKAIEDLINCKAVIQCNKRNIESVLFKTLTSDNTSTINYGTKYFEKNMSLISNSKILKKYIDDVDSNEIKDVLMSLCINTDSLLFCRNLISTHHYCPVV